MEKRFLLATLALAFSIAGTALAQGPTVINSRRIAFPPVGLASTETAQVNLTNTAPNPTSTSAIPASCAGTVSFLNAAGALIGTARPFTATSGQTASVSLPFNSAGLSGRGVIRAIVAVTVSATPVPACALTTSLETFDTSSGATHAYLAGGDMIVSIGRGN